MYFVCTSNLSQFVAFLLCQGCTGNLRTATEKQSILKPFPETAARLNPVVRSVLKYSTKCLKHVSLGLSGETVITHHSSGLAAPFEASLTECMGCTQMNRVEACMNLSTVSIVSI